MGRWIFSSAGSAKTAIRSSHRGCCFCGLAVSQRVEHLFDDLTPGEQPPAWTAAWQPKTGSTKRVEHLSHVVRAYLACPYRFYLRHVQGMRRI